mmetsp:Transcript_12918/g.16588  ORF Transcript_12918/g.16588 Transcript_12918/m.16588 type:complete len:231 (-) Transcript_12918:274-966(-)
MLVISDEQALRVGGEGRLTSAREAEQDGGVAIGADIGGAMHAKGATLGHVVVHDAEDTFLHLTGVGGAEDDQLLGGEVDGDRGLVANIGETGVSDELTGVHDGEVGAASREVLLDSLELVSNQHLLHEKGVVRASRDNTRLDAIIFVPARISVDHEKSLTQVEEVDSSLLVGVVALGGAWDVDVTPVDSIASHIVLDDTLLLWDASGLGAGANAESTRLCDGVGADGGVG